MKCSSLFVMFGYALFGGIAMGDEHLTIKDQSTDEYYVIQTPTHHCTVMGVGPAANNVVLQPGPLAWPLPFRSQVEAEDYIKQSKDCDAVELGDSTPALQR
jgi:hypothetical protein